MKAARWRTPASTTHSAPRYSSGFIFVFILFVCLTFPQVTIKHYLSVDPVVSVAGQPGSPSMAPVYTRELNFPPAVLVGSGKAITPTFAPLAASLPDNVHLTSWIVRDAHTVILRLTHIFLPNEHPTLSAPATVAMCPGLLPAALCSRLTNAQEMLAGGNTPLSSVQRLDWRVDPARGGTTSSPPTRATAFKFTPGQCAVTLESGTIRTFQLTFS